MLVDIGGLSTNVHVGGYSIAKPTTLDRHSADTLLTLSRYSTDTWSALSALFSTQTALVCVAHHNGRHMPLVNMIMFTLDTWHSAKISVEYWSTLPANSPPISLSSIDRHYRPTLGRYSTDIPADTYRPSIDRHYRPILNRDLGRHYRPTLSRNLGIDRHYRPTLGRYLDRVLTATIGLYSTDISADTIGRHSVEISVKYWRHYQPILHQHLGRHYRPTLGRNLGRVSTDTIGWYSSVAPSVGR